MKNFRQIIYWTVCLAVIASCTKDTAIPGYNNGDCGTVATLPSWTKTLSDNHLIGDWEITKISYSCGNGSTHYFDTIYYPNQTLKLSTSGSGTLNLSIPINWTYNSVPNNFPKMTLTNINSLFNMPVNFISNNSTDIYIQSNPDAYFESYPHKRFFANFGKGLNGNWEQGSIQFERH
jgi:hypothetical protein